MTYTYKMDREKILQGVKLLLEGIGEDPKREGLTATPKRVANMLETFQKISLINEESLFDTKFHIENYDDFVLIKNIHFSSFCEHHLMPFFGKISIAYLPAENTVIGLSKIARIIEKYSKYLQLQERMTHQIANALNKYINNHGVFVFIDAHHMCMGARGVMQPSCSTTTRTLIGDFKTNQTLTTQVQQIILSSKNV